MARFLLRHGDTDWLNAVVAGTRYIVVDCGGGTVDITAHEMTSARGELHEIFKATGGPHGSVGLAVRLFNFNNGSWALCWPFLYA